jgi:AcrR family transcriptional regulator
MYMRIVQFVQERVAGGMGQSERAESGAGIDRAAEKRRRILSAARLLMLRHGIRGTSMELIARAAGIAKPTLYAQFADKEAVLAGIVAELLVELDAAFSAGLAGPGSAAERVGAALAGKYGVIARWLDGSPHAEELMSEHHRMAGLFREFDERVEGEIEGVLAAAGVSGAGGLARVVIAAAFGIAGKLGDGREVEEATRVMCWRMIEPEVGER